MSLPLSHLQYFKSLLDGTADISWNAWFPKHESELKADLPRAAFLRLKFDNLDEAEKLLNENNVTYRKDPTSYRREKYYSMLSPDVLDDLGRPLESFRRASYDGALGKLIDGEVEDGERVLQAFIKKVRRYPIERRQEEIESLCFDGEMELTSGNSLIGRSLLEAVVTVPLGNDATDFAVKRAIELLKAADHEAPGPDSAAPSIDP